MPHRLLLNEEPNACVHQLKVLGDKTRLGVMELLMQQPRTVSELGALLHTEQSLLSHHLKILRDAELVESSRQKNQVLYSLPERVMPPGKDCIDLGCCCLAFNKTTENR